jgi:Uma2 family endonuclease
MTTVSVKYTYQELLTTSDNRDRYEIFEGERIVTPSPNRAHQRAVAQLLFLLTTHVKQEKSGEIYPGPIDVCFGEETVVGPDLLFISKDRRSIIDKQVVRVAPDRMIEALSP